LRGDGKTYYPGKPFQREKERDLPCILSMLVDKPLRKWGVDINAAPTLPNALYIFSLEIPKRDFFP
jgi:hypothetical protein